MSRRLGQLAANCPDDLSDHWLLVGPGCRDRVYHGGGCRQHAAGHECKYGPLAARAHRLSIHLADVACSWPPNDIRYQARAMDGGIWTLSILFVLLVWLVAFTFGWTLIYMVLGLRLD
jgi:hypothetical protein